MRWLIVFAVALTSLGQAGQEEPAELLPLELEPIAPAEEILPEPEPAKPKLQPHHAPGTVLYVNASSLALRTGPKRDAALVHYVQRDGRVVALDDVLDPVEATISGKTGQWVYVQHGAHKGYLFDPYLIRAPSALEDSIDWMSVPGERVGPISILTTLEDLKIIFGDVNVADVDIPLGEGKTERGTVIFPDDDDRKLMIQWEIRNVKPKSAIITGAKWRTNKGVSVGTRLSSLLAANSAPISFAGFGWDYAGYVISWRGGALEVDHMLGERFSLYLEPRRPYLAEDYDAMTGDREFSSEMAEAGRLNLHVKSMTIMFNE